MAISLAQLRRRAITRIQGELAKSSDFLTPDILDPWLSDAYIEIQRRVALLTGSNTQELTLDTARFSRPGDMLDNMVLGDHSVRVKDAGGNVMHLAERTWEYMLERYGDFTNPSSHHGPKEWTWDINDQEKIIVQWPVIATVANGLIIDYVKQPAELNRTYDDDTATVTVTNASATVTFAASISGLVEADDVFGVKANADSLPTRWYRVLSVDSTTQITLTENYAGATDSAALFTLSQVSEIEWARPGLVRYAPVEYALVLAAQMEQGESAAMIYRQTWELEIERIREESRRRPGLQFEGKRAYRSHPALRNKIY